VYEINVKNKPLFSMPDGMIMVSAMFHVKEDLGSKSMS
jgi:hypothetical protein